MSDTQISLGSLEWLNELFSLILSWMSFVPIALGVAVVTTFVSRRDLRTLLFLVGIVVNVVVNQVLKKIINESRPPESDRYGSGMPSNHSQFMGFFSIYLILLAYRGKVFDNGSSAPLWISIGLILLTFGVGVSRVHTGHHTLEQVVVGACLVGPIMAIVWWIADSRLRPLFVPLLSSRYARALYLRDTSHIPNIYRFEYMNATSYRPPKNQ